jgi:glycosyltransferase involved in cell wall biosynthesis
MKEAAYLALPSVNYEGFPKTIVEALARGTPVVASRLGAMEEAIEDGVTGRLFTAGDPADLASVVDDLQHNPQATSAMRAHARAAFVERYTPDQNYAIMTEIYRQALARRA